MISPPSGRPSTGSNLGVRRPLNDLLAAALLERSRLSGHAPLATDISLLGDHGHMGQRMAEFLRSADPSSPVPNPAVQQLAQVLNPTPQAAPVRLPGLDQPSSRPRPKSARPQPSGDRPPRLAQPTSTVKRPRQGRVGRNAGIPLPSKATLERTQDVTDFVTEAVPQAVGGVFDALEQTADTLERIIPLGTFEIVDGRLVHRSVDPDRERGFVEVAPAKTTAGDFVRSTTQFLTGLTPAAKAAQALKIAKGVEKSVRALGLDGLLAANAGTFAETLAATQFAGQLVFDPNDPNLANFLADNFELSGPIIDFLQTDPDDSEAENRLKSFIIDAGLGAALAPLTIALSAYRRGRAIREKAKESLIDAINLHPSYRAVNSKLDVPKKHDSLKRKLLSKVLTEEKLKQWDLAEGLRFEKKFHRVFRNLLLDLDTKIYIRVKDGGTFIPDFAASDPRGGFRLIEVKSTPGAPRNPNQKRGHRQFRETGGETRSHNKPLYPLGTKSPPKEIFVVRPNRGPIYDDR